MNPRKDYEAIYQARDEVLRAAKKWHLIYGDRNKVTNSTPSKELSAVGLLTRTIDNLLKLEKKGTK